MATSNTTTPDDEATIVAMYNMKAYMLPVVIFLGFVLNLWSFIALLRSSCRRRLGSEDWSHLVSALGNMLLLFFRPTVSLWSGDGLNYSTNGAAYYYLDQIDATTCKWLRGVGFVAEAIPIASEMFAAIESATKVVSPKKSRLPIILTGIYSISAATILSIVSYYVIDLSSADSSLSGKFCTFQTSRGLNVILIAVLLTLMFALPITVMLICSLIIISIQLKSKCRAVDLETFWSTVIGSASYNLFLWPFVAVGFTVVSNVQSGNPHMEEIGNMLILCVLISFVLPTIDFFCFLIHKCFRDDLFCRSSKEQSKSDPTLVSVVIISTTL